MERKSIINTLMTSKPYTIWDERRAVFSAIVAGVPVLLEGPPSTGKTTFARMVSNYINSDINIVNLSNNDELKPIVTIDGRLTIPEAIRKSDDRDGLILVVDEYNANIPPSSLVTLLSIDYLRVYIKQNNFRVRFNSIEIDYVVRFILTQNPIEEGIGQHDLSDAEQSRVLKFKYNPDINVFINDIITLYNDNFGLDGVIYEDITPDYKYISDKEFFERLKEVTKLLHSIYMPILKQNPGIAKYSRIYINFIKTLASSIILYPNKYDRIYRVLLKILPIELSEILDLSRIKIDVKSIIENPDKILDYPQYMFYAICLQIKDFISDKPESYKVKVLKSVYNVIKDYNDMLIVFSDVLPIDIIAQDIIEDKFKTLDLD